MATSRFKRPAESWNLAHARDLTAVALRFIERGDAPSAIAALAKTIEVLVGEAARWSERGARRNVKG